ncbi:hypothetical protein QBC33DRAFT_520030 [Phialemonium atrogriseum]|uniref:Uncharacterized protein n=1 Tax=Phialemonium atrogriseum TaxID=1093897 RepID=A0AAJ0BTU1_9PEZI|nr:uncharacterized protein QBC33DRAFT_520030 [Phialemonium atrogriseum]KAK1761916.1 hypothetical protein QBC33DRAFT_520030 [Phialemonium atrogriseum]
MAPIQSSPRGSSQNPHEGLSFLVIRFPNTIPVQLRIHFGRFTSEVKFCMDIPDPNGTKLPAGGDGEFRPVARPAVGQELPRSSYILADLIPPANRAIGLSPPAAGANLELFDVYDFICILARTPLVGNAGQRLLDRYANDPGHSNRLRTLATRYLAQIRGDTNPFIAAWGRHERWFPMHLAGVHFWCEPDWAEGSKMDVSEGHCADGLAD